MNAPSEVASIRQSQTQSKNLHNPSPKATTTLYLGADLSKATIDCRISDFVFTITNDPAGFAQLGLRLRPFSDQSVHVLCEATGGCQDKSVAPLHAKAIPLSVINPRQVRDFARSRNILAKTYRIDAAVLAAFGPANSPQADEHVPAHLQRLALLLAARDHLVAQRAQEKTRIHRRGVKRFRYELAVRFRRRLPRCGGAGMMFGSHDRPR